MSHSVIEVQLSMARAALDALAVRHIASDDADAAEMKQIAQEALEAINALSITQ